MNALFDGSALPFPFSKLPRLGLQERGPLLHHQPASPKPCPFPRGRSFACPREDALMLQTPRSAKLCSLFKLVAKGCSSLYPQEHGGDFAGGEIEARKREGNTRSCLPACTRIALLLLSRSKKWATFPPASSFCLLNRKASLWSPGLLSLLPQVTTAVGGDCCCLLRTP